MPYAPAADDDPDNPDPAEQGTQGDRDMPPDVDLGDWLPEDDPDDAPRQSER